MSDLSSIGGAEFKEIGREEAENLINKYAEGDYYKKILLDENAQPGFLVAYKEFFEGMCVFPVNLSSDVMLVISCDRSRFWLRI